MKKLLSLWFLVITGVVWSQDDSSPRTDTAWKAGGTLSLQFNQAAYSNWQSGGVNSIAGNGLINLFANYDDGGTWSWTNILNLAYGVNIQETVFNKTDDRIELESRVDRKLNKIWSASALANFRTQFNEGFAEPGQTEDSLRISNFMAPGYLVVGLGFTYKPSKHFNAFISPVTSKMTFVLDQRLSNLGAFGVTPGEQFRQEVGGYVNMTYRRALMENVDLQTRLDLFSNYLNNNYQFIDVNGELILFMKINKFLTANVALHVIYDHDVEFDTDGDGVLNGPRTQLREVLGVGLAYRFGDKMKKE